MKKIFNNFVILIFFICTSCGGGFENVKRGLSGEKKVSSEEFLVKKKDPLVLPPKFDELPEPGGSVVFGQEDDEVTDIEDLLRVKSNDSDSPKVESGGNLEESVLRKIKKD